jgi:hypothetical protein
MKKAPFCPVNKNDPDFVKLVNRYGENQAYYIWSEYEGVVPLQIVNGNKRAKTTTSLIGVEEYRETIDTVKAVFINLLNTYQQNKSINGETISSKKLTDFVNGLLGDAEFKGHIPRWFLKNSVSINGERLSAELFNEYAALWDKYAQASFNKALENQIREELINFQDAYNIDNIPPNSYATPEGMDRELIAEKFEMVYQLWGSKLDEAGNPAYQGLQEALVGELKSLGYKTFGKQVTRDQEEFGEIEEGNVGITEKIYALSSFETNVNRSKGATYNRLLSRVLSLTTNSFGYQTYRGPRRVHQQLLRILEGVKTKEDVFKRLEGNKSAIVRSTNLLRVIENFNEEEFTQFLGLFTTIKQKYVAISNKFDAKGNKIALFYNPDRRNAVSLGLDTLINQVVGPGEDSLTLLKLKNGKLTYNPKFSPDIINKLNVLLREHDDARRTFAQDDATSYLTSIGKILYELGIDFGEGSIEESAEEFVLRVKSYMVKNGTFGGKAITDFKKQFAATFLSSLKDVFKVEQIGKTGDFKITGVKVAPKNFVSNNKTPFKWLAEVMYSENENIADSFINASGNNQYAWTYSSTLDEFFKEIEKDEKTEAFLKEFENMYSVGSPGHPEYASLLFQLIKKGGVKHAEATFLETEDGDKFPVKSLPERDRLIMQLDAYINEGKTNARINLIADGDRLNRLPLLELPRLYSQSQLDTVTNNLPTNVKKNVDIIRNILIRDLRRIYIENQNLEAQKFLRADARFSLSKMKDTEIDGVTLSAQIEDMLNSERDSIVYSKFWEEIDRQAQEWVDITLEEMTNQFYQKLIDYKIVKVSRNPIGKSKLGLNQDEREQLLTSTEPVVLELEDKRLRYLEDKQLGGVARYQVVSTQRGDAYFEIQMSGGNEVTFTRVKDESTIEFGEETTKSRLSGFAKIIEKSAEEDSTKTLVRSFVFDRAVYKVEYVDMFSGGKSRFKSDSEIYKRWSLFSTPGEPPVIEDLEAEDPIGMPETYNEASLEDLKIFDDAHNQIADEIVEALKRQRKKLLAEGEELTKEDIDEIESIGNSLRTGKADIADALGIISEEMDVNLRKGYYRTWTQEEKEAFEFYKNTGKYIFDIIPHKFIYVATRNTANPGQGNSGNMQQVFDADKNSYLVMTKELAAKSELFQYLYDLMKEGNIQVLNFRSGKKGIKDNLNRVQDPQTGELLPIKLTPTVQYSKDLRMVQRVTTPTRFKTKVGKQVRNNQLTNILSDDEIILNSKFPDRAVKLTGRELKKLYAALYYRYFEIKDQVLNNTFSFNTALEADPLTAFFGKNELMEAYREHFLEQEESRNGYITPDVAESAELINTVQGVDFNLPMSFPGSREFESFVTKLISKKVLDLELPGANYVVAPGSGKFSIIGQNGEESYRELQMYGVKDGEIQYAEMAVSPEFLTKFGYQIGDNIDLNTLLKVIPEEARVGLTYRTPHTGKSSTVVFKIVSLLPDTYKKHIFVPGNIVTVTGMDFDFDKLFALFYNLEVTTNEEGEQEVYRIPGVYTLEDLQTASVKEIENTMLEILEAIQFQEKHFEEAITPLNTEMYEDFIEKYIVDDYRASDILFESPLYDVQVVTRYQVAQKLVGIYANAYTGLGILTTSSEQIDNAKEIGAYIHTSKSIQYEDSNSSLVVNGVTIYDELVGKRGTFQLDRVVSTSPITGKPITYYLTKDISGAVDAGNNPYQASINEGPETANAKVFLESLGIDGRIVSLLINSHKVRAVTTAFRNNQKEGMNTAFMYPDGDVRGLDYVFLKDVRKHSPNLALPTFNVTDLYFINAYRTGKLDQLIASLPQTSPVVQTARDIAGVKLETNLQIVPATTYKGIDIDESNTRSAEGTLSFVFKADNNTKKIKQFAEKYERGFLEIDISSGYVVTDEMVDSIVDFINSRDIKTLHITGNNVFGLFDKNQTVANEFMQELLSKVKDAGGEISTLIARGESGIQEAAIKAADMLDITTTIRAPKNYSYTTKLNTIVEGEENFLRRFGIGSVETETVSPKQYEFDSVESLERKVEEIETSALKLFAAAHFAGKELMNDYALITPDKLDEVTDLFLILEYLGKLDAMDRGTEQRLLDKGILQDIISNGKSLQGAYVNSYRRTIQKEGLTNIAAFDSMQSMIDHIRTIVGKDYLQAAELKLLTRVLNYWMLTKEGSPISSWYNETTMKRLYFEEENLKTRLDLLKQNPALRNNPLIQRLDTLEVGSKEEQAGINVVVLSGVDEISAEDTKELKDALAEMLYSPSKITKDSESRKRIQRFAEDLIYNAFFATAFLPTYGGYTNLIPERFLTEPRKEETKSLVKFYREELDKASKDPTYFLSGNALFDVIRAIGHTNPGKFSPLIPRYTGKVSEATIDEVVLERDVKTYIKEKIQANKDFEGLSTAKQEELVKALEAEARKEINAWNSIIINPRQFAVDENQLEDYMDSEIIYDSKSQVDGFIELNLPVFITRKTKLKSFPVITYMRVGEIEYAPIQPLGMGKNFFELNLRSVTGKIKNDSIFTTDSRQRTDKGLKKIPQASIKYLKQAREITLDLRESSNTKSTKKCNS